MEKSIFSYLISYVPTNKRESKEDYLTQMFAWLLSNIEGFADSYIEFLCSNNENIILPAEKDRRIVISTQETLPTGRIDLLIRVNEELSFICEHKVHSELSENQIQKYMDASSLLGAGTYYSVLVTFSATQHTQKADVSITWSDVCEFVEELLQNYVHEDLFILKQFVEYLKENGMGKADPISKEALLGYWPAINLEHRLGALFASMEGYDWTKNCPKLLDKTLLDYSPQNNKKRWGRIGIDFCSEWNPGIFAGVLLLTSDHGLYPMDIKKGPDFVIFLESEYSRSNSKKREMYENFITSEWYTQRLQKLKANSGDFEFMPGIDKSPWRTIVLRRPLYDVLENCYTRDEQLNALIKCMEDGINILLGE